MREPIEMKSKRRRKEEINKFEKEIRSYESNPMFSESIDIGGIQ